MSRRQHERTISSLYGCPGTDYETENGNELLLDVIRELGFEALSDDCLRRLADKNQYADRTNSFRTTTKQ